VSIVVVREGAHLRFLTTHDSQWTMERSQKTSLSALFAGSGLIDVLSLLLMHPDEEFYQREISRLTGLRLLQVQRAVERIADAGLVVERRRGNRLYYRADREHPAFSDLQQVMLKTVGLADRLRAALAPIADRLEVAFVYGSLARGEETARSDIDLIAIGDITLQEFAAAVGPVAKETRQEWRDRTRAGHHMIATVAASPKLWLIGSQGDLERLAL
jgi:DNA-binding transcriptional ArsR family regulator